MFTRITGLVFMLTAISGAATAQEHVTFPSADGKTALSAYVFLPAKRDARMPAVVFYPACGLRGRFDDGYRPYAPVRVFHGTADEETSYRQCRSLVERSRKAGGDIDITLYLAANHGFDDPGRAQQAISANRTAKADATARALTLFAEQLAPQPPKP